MGAVPPKLIKLLEITARDGTSQAGRPLGALDPGYVAVDERTIADLIAFAREYGAGLNYFGLDDQHAGDWSAFVDPAKPSAPDARAAFLTKVAAFMKEPERFDSSTSPELFRPHFVLFLVFIKLFQKSQAELNGLTRRHLEFYYRHILRMLEKGPIPDRLNLIFDLRKGVNEVMVPRGTRLSAGPDSLGRERIYTTDHDLIANQAKIAALRSVFVEQRITGVKEARERGRKDRDLEGAVLGMFEIALGDPQPGDTLPSYPGPGGSPVTFAKLEELDRLTGLTSETDGFHLSLNEIRDLMRLKQVAGKIDNQLHKIVAVIEVAARRRKVPPPPAPSKFDPSELSAYFDAALGMVSPAGGSPLGIEAYWVKIQEVEEFFFMTVESFHDVLVQITLQDPAGERADSLLEKAREEKIHAARRKQFAASVYDPKAPLETKEETLGRLIMIAMGSESASKLDLVPLLGPTLTLTDLNKAVDAIPSDWSRVASILEVVLSNRIGVPAAQKVEWLNLHPAQDAKAVGPRRAPGGQQAVAARAKSQWATFGLAPPAEESSSPAPVLGWAISSPLFELSQGTREITLTLGFDPASVGAAGLAAMCESRSFVFEISTAQGWVACASKLVNDPLGVASPDAPVNVQFKLTIGPEIDPIVPLPAAVTDIDTPWPLVRLMLLPTWDVAKARHVIRHPELRGLMLSAVHVKVGVQGLKPLRLQNDQSALNPKKPFEPFGSAPTVGTRLLIGHPEVLTKKLDSLTFKFEWMGAPANLADHYANYPVADLLANPGADTAADTAEDSLSGGQAFTAWVSLVDRSVALDLNKAAQLFGSETIISIPTNIPQTGKAIDSTTIAKASFEADLSSWPRYLQWELNAPDFQHEAYPAVASAKAVELAADIANKSSNSSLPPIASADYKVKPPYTPKLKSLWLDYSASVDVKLNAVSASDVRLFHVHPFGSCSIEAERSATGLPFLPRYDNEGELYIGLADVSPPQTVAILFQMAEGSANPDVERQPIAWSYLDADRWISLDNRVLLDTTRGLINTGIVELALQPAAASTRLRGGLYWVRATLARNSAAVCDAIALHPQAMSTTFIDHDNAPDHFKNPLPPATITKLAAPLAGIAGVRQPYSSFGGRMAEAQGMWATRVSERLRHKQRALSAWDHERLVLDRFPEIYKAKCIPASPDRPGEVSIIVIPDIRDLMPSDPFEPKAPSKLLADVEEFLAAKATAFTTVKARNAHYVAVRVRLAVRFTGPGNEGYYVRTLNDELNRFLSPWAYEDGADIAIGGKIYANSIADFADRRPYVDYVAAVELFRSDDGEHFTPANSVAEAGRHDAVLVAARTHQIDVVRDAVYDETVMRGIGFMKLELDFIVA